MPHRILIIEDDEELIFILKTLLRGPEYLVHCEGAGAKGIECALAWQPHLVILDLGLPGLGGMEALRIMRRDGRTRLIPVLILSGHACKEDIIAGLNAGADDYLAKPFSKGELVARVAAILRRFPAREEISLEVLRLGPLVLECGTSRVLVHDRPVDLNPKEFSLLETIMRNQGKVLSRHYLLDTVWGYDVSVTARTVDQHVSMLRKKLGPSFSSALQTLYKKGYCLRPPKP